MSPTLNLISTNAVLLLTCLLVSGCGKSEDQKKLEFASATVQHALDSWKQGGKPEELKSDPEPIEFYDDDWDRSAKLIDFKIRQAYMDSDGTARCSVLLTVQYGTQAPIEVKCAYQIVTKPTVIIGRDPMA